MKASAASFVIIFDQYIGLIPKMGARSSETACSSVRVHSNLNTGQFSARVNTLAQFGITAPQNAVLLAVPGNPRISNAELARSVFVTPQTMQAFLVNLERGDLIVRSPHPEHGRVIMTELTMTGQKAVVNGAKAADAVEQQMLSMLSTEEALLLCEFLKRCAAALDDEPSDS